MTLATRNAILLAGLIFAFLVLALSIYVVVLLLATGYHVAEGTFSSTRTWLVWTWKTTRGAFAATIVEIVVLAIAAAGGGLLLRRYFLKTSAPEIFFFIVFILSLCFDSLKAVHVLLLVHDVPSYYGVIVTRAVYFGHFAGMFCLLAASLYAVGVQYQKHATALGIAALVAFAVAYIVPVDSLVLYPTLVYRVGNESTIQIILLILSVLIVSSYGTAVLKETTNERAVTALAICLAVIGRELLFVSEGPIGIGMGLALVLAGGAMFGLKNYDLYLWT